jgi:hypothetical protein
MHCGTVCGYEVRVNETKKHRRNEENCNRHTANCNIHTAVTRKLDTQPSAPHYTDNLKTKHQIRQAATNCIILSSS